MTAFLGKSFAFQWLYSYLDILADETVVIQ